MVNIDQFTGVEQTLDEWLTDLEETYGNEEPQPLVDVKKE